MSEIKFKDVERFVRFLISMGGVYTVDDNNYVANKNDEEPVLIKVDNKFHQIMVLHEPIKDPDAVIVNPLAENLIESQESKWLYLNLSVGLASRIIAIVRFINTVITNSSADQDMHVSAEVMKFVSKHKDFDAKAMEHFEQIVKKKMNFVNVWYVRKLKQAKFRCSVYDPDTKTEFPSITKKSWNAITGILNDIFGLDKDPEKAADSLQEAFTVTSDLITSPKLEAILTVYLRIYQKLNKYMVLCGMDDDDDFIIDLTELSVHIANIPQYYEKVKWIAGTMATAIPSNTSTQAITNVALPSASGIPNNPLTNPARISYTEAESGIPSNPARHGLEYANQQNFHPQQQMAFGMNRGGCIPCNTTIFGGGGGYNSQMIQPMNQPFGQPVGGYGIPIR